MRVETVEEYLARGGRITRLPSCGGHYGPPHRTPAAALAAGRARHWWAKGLSCWYLPAGEPGILYDRVWLEGVRLRPLRRRA